MVKKPTEPLEKEEVDSLIRESMSDDYYYTLFMFAKTTGRRLGEIYGIRVKDINFERGICYTLVLKRRRRVEKEAILTPEMSSLLQRYIAQNKLKLEDYVFRKVSIRQIQHKIKRYAKKAGITKNVTFHNFRHFFVTSLVRKGWSYDKIAKLTGHSAVGTLALYDSAVASDIKEDALEALKDL